MLDRALHLVSSIDDCVCGELSSIVSEECMRMKPEEEWLALEARLRMTAHIDNLDRSLRIRRPFLCLFRVTLSNQYIHQPKYWATM